MKYEVSGLLRRRATGSLPQHSPDFLYYYFMSVSCDKFATLFILQCLPNRLFLIGKRIRVVVGENNKLQQPSDLK